MSIELETDEDAALDMKAIRGDIAKGAKAYGEILKNAGRDWTHWSATILGLRGLRSLAFVKAGTNNMRSQAYREAMGSLLDQRQYAVYDRIDKQTRSDCYRMMDQLEAVDAWYAGIDTADKLRWRHPSSIAKHCPPRYLVDGMRKDNRPPRATPVKKKPAVSVETERLKALLIQIIKRLAKYEPEALDLLDQVHPNADDSDLDDPINDVEGR